MRLAAYKKALEEAKALPEIIPELLSYFKTRYSPYLEALHYIFKMAREDKSLFDSEFCELYEWHLTSRSSRAAEAVPVCKCREPDEVCELHGGSSLAKPPPA